MGLNRAILRNKKFSEKLDLLLVRSGNVFGWNIEALLFYKELGGGLGLLFMWKLNISKPLAWIAAAYIGFLLPELYVKSKGAPLQAAIQTHLPGLADLLPF